jgi:hypothetical protein
MTLKIANRRVSPEMKEKLNPMLTSWATLGREIGNLDLEEAQDAIALEISNGGRMQIVDRLMSRINSCRTIEVVKEVKRAFAATIDNDVAPRNKGRKVAPKAKPEKDEEEADEVDEKDEV